MNRLPVVVALVCLSAGPADAQSISDRFERLFGPPVAADGSAPSRRPRTSRPATPPASAAGDASVPDNVPLPTIRPPEPESEPQDLPPSEETAEPVEPAQQEAPQPEEPAAEEALQPEEPAPQEALQPEGDPSVPPAMPVPIPQSAPPQDPAESADTDAEGGEPADAAGEQDDGPAADGVEAEPDGAEPDAAAPPPPVQEPSPTPAYVSPERARTEPEPEAPQTPPAGATPEESAAAAAAIEDATICEAELLARGAEFSVGASISEGDCGVLRPVQMTRSSAGIAIEPATQMLCRTALAFDIWVSDGLVPAAEEVLDAGPPETIRHASTYVCRPRSSEASISEHARGSAIDVASIEWADREPIVVEKQAPGSAEDRFLAEIRRAACGPFKTVIGPGTDADHSDHFHLDIAARSNDSTYCR